MQSRFHRRLGFAVCLVPLALGLALVGPGMVSRADGCSGATGYAAKGWHTLHWPSDTSAPTDAVVVLRGTLADMQPSDALAALTVTLTDASGGGVDGTLALESLSDDGVQGADEVLVVFKPTSPLAPAASYSLHWEVDAAAQAAPYLSTSGDGTLKTVAAASVDNAPSAESPQFGRQSELTGPIVFCSRGPTACPPSTSFGSEETRRPTLTLAWSYVEGQSSQYQLTTVEPVTGKGELIEVPSTEAHIAHTTTTNRSVTVRFADEIDEYCVRLVTRDLRDQSEHVSDPLCAARVEVPAPEVSLLEQALESCLEPPTDALTAAWCQSHTDDPRCASSEDDGGCRLAPRASAEGWSHAWLWALAALGIFCRRRR